jgi:hypothetical protein
MKKKLRAICQNSGKFETQDNFEIYLGDLAYLENIVEILKSSD